ncbi:MULTISPECIES: hypothetical protein [unclassified Microcoleus]|uniref:hypothetical protein n=1 Tax=unclassified Microcoleus TaxID=2642155 RepID=UPI002FD56529
MPFQKKQKLGFVPTNGVAYDKTPVQVKVRPGVREQLKAVDDWQNKLRQLIDQLIEEELGG